MFSFTKVFVALMAATAVVAAPSKRQSFDLTTCTFDLTPSVAPGAIDFDTEFNYLIGRTLAQQVSGTTITGSNQSITPNTDGTFTVVRSNGVDGKTAAETADILEGLIGSSNNGFANGAAIDWTFTNVVCDA